MTVIGKIKEIWRYPVKSMQGNLVDEVSVDRRGLAGDRYWALRNEQLGQLITVRKMPTLLNCKAEYIAEPKLQMDKAPHPDSIPDVLITLPDGVQVASRDPRCADLLSDLLDVEVSMWPLQPASNWKHYKATQRMTASTLRVDHDSNVLPSPASFSLKLIIELMMFVTPRGHYYDCFPVHMLTTGALKKLKDIAPKGDFCSQRFRPNLLIDTLAYDSAQWESFDEFSWVGGQLQIGETLLKVESPTVRCLLPSQPQANLKKDTTVLRTVQKYADMHMGVNLTTLRRGTINVGDEVVFLPNKCARWVRSIATFGTRQKVRLLNAMMEKMDK